MLGVLEGLSGVVAAAMAGELGLSVEDADAGGAGEQRERLADVGVGNRVGIAVEADVGGFAGADGADEFGLEGMGGERQEAGLLFGPDVGDGTVRLVGVASAVGDVVAPASELGVEVVEVAEGAGGEEGVPEVLDLAFDLALLRFRVPGCRAGARSGSGRRGRAGGGETVRRRRGGRGPRCAGCRRRGCGRRRRGRRRRRRDRGGSSPASGRG